MLATQAPCVSLPQVYELPFLVALDHRKESVVVAVRGTMSLQVRSRRGSPGTRGRVTRSQRPRHLCQNRGKAVVSSRVRQENAGTGDEEANPGL